MQFCCDEALAQGLIFRASAVLDAPCMQLKFVSYSKVTKQGNNLLFSKLPKLSVSILRKVLFSIGIVQPLDDLPRRELRSETEERVMAKQIRKGGAAHNRREMTVTRRRHCDTTYKTCYRILFSMAFSGILVS